jgi:hypothetical protein
MMQKLAGLIMVIGAAIAFYGESRPSILAVYGSSDMQTQLEAIAANSGGWATANTLMAAGGIVVAVGLILFAVQVQSLGVAQRVKTAAFAGAGAALLGALIHGVERYNNIHAWETYAGFPFPYPLAWIAGLALIGLVMLWSAYPNWLGWVLIVASVLLLAGALVGFLPPALVYFPLVAMAVVLLIKSTPPSMTVNPVSGMA